MDNFAVDIGLYFDTADHCDEFIRVYDEMAKTVSQELRIDVDEVFAAEDDNTYCQLVGTADDVPGKRALNYLSGLCGVNKIEVWYDGGDRDWGELFFTNRSGEVVHQYLPTEFKPAGTYDAGKVAEAYDLHKSTEVIALENMWE